jgi:hypothetical protein
MEGEMGMMGDYTREQAISYANDNYARFGTPWVVFKYPWGSYGWADKREVGDLEIVYETK